MATKLTVAWVFWAKITLIVQLLEGFTVIVLPEILQLAVPELTWASAT